MRRLICSVVACLLLPLLTVVLPVGGASGVQVAQDRVVSDDPANFTPHVLDGRVLSIAQVGNLIVLGGSFTQVQEADGSPTLSRRNLVAFNATTGQLSTSFAPNPDGDVTTVIPAGDGTSVFVGGNFNNISGASSPSLARIRVSDGARVAGFTAPTMTGRVKDLRLADNRLWVAGTFTHVAGTSQPALTTLNAGTGALDPYMSLVFDGIQAGGTTAVTKMDVNPAQTRLVAIGNFRTVDGQEKRQLAMLDISGSSAALADWNTTLYGASCSSSFYTYMRDLDFSPDGSYFAVTTTGAYGGSESPCDTTARFETDAVGTDVRPTWLDYTGGDTTYAVAVTGTAVYTGGHARWQNNPFAGDRAGPGAVSRPGIAALDPVNGLPLSWNPTRTRGVGVFDMLATSQGLWIGSDTDRVGAWEYHARVAFFPLAGGTQIPATPAATLPNDVFVAGPRGSGADASILYRVNAGGNAVLADVGPEWAVDTNASPSPYRNSGSNVATASGTVSTAASLPAGTPLTMFNTERWDPSGGEEMRWSFPVPESTPVQVRLYFANTYSGTSQPGQRVFDVAIDGQTVLDDYDIVADVGHFTATMKPFERISDGMVDIQLGHVVENPLINAIEIVRTDVGPAQPANTVATYEFDGDAVAQVQPSSDGALSWSSSRDAFMINGQVYAGWSDGSFDRRSFDGQSYGAATAVNTSDLLNPLTAWHNEVASATGMFYDSGRIYFTLAGSSDLYYRYFTPESDVVGAKRFIATSSVSGIDYSQVRGMFLADQYLHWATPDGTLHRAQWAGAAPVPGTVEAVSGPADGGPNWAAHALFAYQGESGEAANQSPTPAVAVQCTSLECAFDGSGSTDADGSLTSYQWDFGDGTTAQGATANHIYAAAGSYTVTLAVIDDDGAKSMVTQEVTVVRVNQGPTASFTIDCAGLECTFDGSQSADPDGSIASYEWDFGDGQTAQGATVSHTYAASGPVTVTLTVTDNEGATGQATHDLSPAETNEPPVASFTIDCTELECAFDGSGSSDPDGSIASYVWDFGDGATDSGAQVSHTYADGGTHTVTLTVFDNGGATGSLSQDVATVAPQAVGVVGARNVNKNSTQFELEVPADVQAGDALVLLFSGNSLVTVNGPAGWAEESQHAGGQMVGRVWSRVAQSGDAGSTVTVTTDGYVKADMSLVAYRGTSTTDPVAVSAVTAADGFSAQHTTPTVPVADPDGWVLSYWSMKSSVSTAWTPPMGQAVRTQSNGAGGGHITALLTDSAAPVGASSGGSLTATADAESSRVVLASIVLNPGS